MAGGTGSKEDEGVGERVLGEGGIERRQRHSATATLTVTTIPRTATMMMMMGHT